MVIAYSSEMFNIVIVLEVSRCIQGIDFLLNFNVFSLKVVD